jgi:N-acetylneuraminic acid mutarotase
MPINSFHAASAHFEGNFYFFGGQDGGDTNYRRMNESFRFDPKALTWTRLASMPTARQSAAAVVLGRKIYVLGGNPADGSPSLATVEIYDVDSNSWTTGPSMPSPRTSLVAGFLKGKIYAFGGYPQARFVRGTSTAQVFDPKTQKWWTSDGSEPFKSR